MKNNWLVTKGLVLLAFLCISIAIQAEEYFIQNQTRTFSSDENYDVPINGIPGILTYSMTEGGLYNSTCKSTFKVLASTDGQNFSELASYTRFNTSATFYLNPDVKYLRFNFSKCWSSNLKCNLNFSIAKALSVNPTSLNLGDIFVGNEPSTKTFTLHYSNSAATATTYNLTCTNPYVTFSPAAVTANAQSNGSQIITVGYSNSSPATGATSATIVATNTNATAQTASVAVSINIKKYTQTLTWKSGIDVISVGDEVTDAASASTNLPVTYTSSNSAIIEVVNGKLVAKTTGTATITATQAGNGVWESVTSQKAIEVTQKVVQRIVWNDDLSRLRVGDVATLSAYAVDNTTGLATGLPITYSMSTTGFATLNGTQLTAVAEGEVVITAYQAGNSNYAPATYQLNARVLSASGQTCNPLVLDAGESNILTVSSKEYTLTGEPGFLTFDAKCVDLLLFWGGDLKVAQYVNGSWVDLFSQCPTKDTYTHYGPFQLDRKATKLKFYTVTGATGYKYFRDIKVTLAKYVEVNKLTINFDVQAGASASNSFTVNYSNLSDVLMVNHSSNAFSFSPSASTLGTGCGDKGTQTFNVALNAPIGGNYEDVVTFSDGVNSAQVTVTAHVTKHAQSITWNQDINIDTENSPLTLTATATSGLPVSYATSNPAIATIEDGKLVLVASGNVSITASQAGNGIYEAAADVTKTITVIKPIALVNPVISIACTTYNDSVRADANKFVTIACSDATPHTLYYTTDGSIPTAASLVYTTPFEITTTTTITAIAIPNDLIYYKASGSVSKTYVVFDCQSYAITDFTNTSDKSTTIHWSGALTGNGTLRYWTGTAQVVENALQAVISGNQHTVTNLLPATTYYFQLADNYGCTSAIDSVTTKAIYTSPLEVFKTAVGSSTTQLISVTSSGLTGTITATLSNNSNNTFTINKTTLSNAGGDIAITYAPTTEGAHTATLTIASDADNTSHVIVLNGYATAITIEQPQVTSESTLLLSNNQINGSIYVYDEHGQLIPTSVKAVSNNYEIQFTQPNALSKLSCKEIKITVKDNADAVLFERPYKVPIIISRDSTTGEINIDTDSCTTCDITILSAAVLSKGSDTKTFRDVYVTSGATLRVPANKELKVRNFYLQSIDDSISSAYVTNNQGKISCSQQIIHIKRITNNSKYFFFSLPYACAMQDIKLSNGKPIGVYGTDWMIKEYNGLQRGTAPQTNNWRALAITDSLVAGKGYIIALGNNTECEIQFPGYLRSTDELAETNYQVTAYGCDPAYDAVKPNNKGWNLIGTPFLSPLNSNSTTSAKITINGNNVQYITAPNNDGKTYKQKKVNEQKIEPFRCFFVQVNTTGKLDFLTSGAVEAPRKAAVHINNEVKLTVTGKNGSDDTEVILGDNETIDYTIGHDLEKMYAAATIPQLYSKTNGYKLAFNALPISDASYIPLGFYAPIAGTYTINVINNSDYGVYLVDNTTGTTTNLSQAPYSFQANKGLTEARFAISVEQRITTAIDSVADGQQPIALMSADGTLNLQNLPVGASIQISDAIGRVIYTTTAHTETLSCTLPIQGVYNIKLVNKGQTQIIRTIR